ncbi:hypothetical protein [Flavobacterium yafengii]|uniref:hypothetical protein n=1 Tax=Flavobacterium yafengii TaxID=3041253 RepID=UPI0024A938A2|nr:hypothetical protein [Flavobacterium yafengii]MDI6047539.1 hypothetical protein [Flavobacterium yafengii]
MKKLLFILFTSFLVSCSSSDSEDSPKPTEPSVQTTRLIRPPTWIQGTWKYVSSNGTVRYNGFTFYKEWFTKYTDIANGYQSGDFVVEEKFTDTSYDVKLGSGITTQWEFHFIKISPTKIKWLNPDTGYADTFTKQ